MSGPYLCLITCFTKYIAVGKLSPWSAINTRGCHSSYVRSGPAGINGANLAVQPFPLVALNIPVTGRLSWQILSNVEDSSIAQVSVKY